MPYREMPVGVVPQSDDADDIAIAIGNRDRFARIDPGKLWPAPIDKPFEADGIDTLSVSPDGHWALLCAKGFAWLLNTRTMIARPPIQLPGAAKRSALNHDGSVAVLICGGTLYRLDLATRAQAIAPIWSSPGLAAADVLTLSADGRIAVTTEYRRNATVRVFDLELATLTHSFVADTDECLLLHPGGRHIICFGDDAVMRIYGPKGIAATLHDTAGGAVSADGMTLVINSLDVEDAIRVHSLDVSKPYIGLGAERLFRLGFPVERWNCKATISPTGRIALVKGRDNTTIAVDLQNADAKLLDLCMERKTAIISGENRLLSPYVWARDAGVEARGVAVVSAETGEAAGILCAAHGQPANLVCITSLGLYGSVEAPGRPTGKDFNRPYERPELISSYLSQSKFSLERSDQLCLEEVQARRRAWQPFLGSLTVDISIRELMALNRGLIELTSEIIELAEVSARDAPQFGKLQLNLAGLQAAAAELSALSSGARRARFTEMIARLRRNQPPPVAKAIASVIVAPQASEPLGLVDLQELEPDHELKADEDSIVPVHKEQALVVKPKTSMAIFVVPTIGAAVLALLATILSYLL